MGLRMSPTVTPNFGVEQERVDGQRFLVVARGALDLFAAPALKRRLLEAVEGGAREIVLDLSETAFLDSTALGALLTAHRRLDGRGGRLTIVPGPATVMRVFRLTGLDSILAIAPTRELALGGSEN